MTATWYLEWEGKTYTASAVGGEMQPWEAYAGEAYGAKKLDDNTFAFIFQGIGVELTGAAIWCVIEDGHYDVTSQKAYITVGGSATPPEILDIPAQITVTQGAQAELRCIARSNDGSQLGYVWYETSTGRLQDITALDRGAQTSDFIFCDTGAAGTRYYVCAVSTTNGGMAYSSVVPVTVTEAPAVPTTEAPATPATEATQATQAAAAEDTAPATSEETTLPAATEAVADIAPAESTAPTVTEDKPGLPWWSLVLVGLAAAGIGVAVAVVLSKKK